MTMTRKQISKYYGLTYAQVESLLHLSDAPKPIGMIKKEYFYDKHESIKFFNQFKNRAMSDNVFVFSGMQLEIIKFLKPGICNRMGGYDFK